MGSLRLLKRGSLVWLLEWFNRLKFFGIITVVKKRQLNVVVRVVKKGQFRVVIRVFKRAV